MTDQTSTPSAAEVEAACKAAHPGWNMLSDSYRLTQRRRMKIVLRGAYSVRDRQHAAATAAAVMAEREACCREASFFGQGKQGIRTSSMIQAHIMARPAPDGTPALAGLLAKAREEGFEAGAELEWRACDALANQAVRDASSQDAAFGANCVALAIGARIDIRRSNVLHRLREEEKLPTAPSDKD